MKAARQVTGGFSGGGHRGAAGAAAAPGSRSGLHAAEADTTSRQCPPARRKKPRTASTCGPHTHHRELRNGGGTGEEPGRRARRSQSLPPASFEPATKTAEGVGGEGEGGGSARGPTGASEHAQNPRPIGARWADTGAGALGRKALDQGSALPTSPHHYPGPNKTRAGARARGPRSKRQREGQGARMPRGGEGGAERSGKADKRRHLRGPERPAPFSREAASAPRASGLRHSPSGV